MFTTEDTEDHRGKRGMSVSFPCAPRRRLEVGCVGSVPRRRSFFGLTDPEFRWLPRICERVFLDRFETGALPLRSGRMIQYLHRHPSFGKGGRFRVAVNITQEIGKGMKQTVYLGAVVLGFCLTASGLATQADRALVTRAKEAIESGSVDPERHLRPLIDALRKARSEDDQSYLVDSIESMGEADGSSPASVKKFLLVEATPLFLDIARKAKSVFLRGDVLLALRDMGASRPVLEQAATIAEADPDSYVQSRGEILRNFIASMPVEAELEEIAPSDPAKERTAIEYLKDRRLGVSADQLRISSLEGDFEAVQALLEAGVDANAGEASESPLVRAVFSGCGKEGGENDSLIRTVEVLVAAGADPNRKDDNNNTALMSAAQMCGPAIVERLIAAGAEVNYKNGSGISPLAMALILGKVDSAQVLVDKGARLDKAQVEMLSGLPPNPRAQEIIKKAGPR